MTPSHTDHTDPRKHRKVYHAVRTAITSGDIPPGCRIPPITDLTALHAVARGTVSRALRDLVRDGLIAFHPGHGYVATSPSPDALASVATR
jgi:GntR family transcriptional regulator